MSVPTLALIGRPNVGKSTLFNRLTGNRAALVASTPGLTRDRRYGTARVGEREVTLIDTPGITDDPAEPLAAAMSEQSWQAIHEADVVVQVCSAGDGLLPAEEDIIAELRAVAKPTLLVVNKVDNQDENSAIAEFSRMGMGVPVPISAAHGRGLSRLFEVLAQMLPMPAPVPATADAAPEDDAPEDAAPDEDTPVAIIGRPNVGKSTLINRLLGEERVLVSDLAGTTHDNVDISMCRDGRDYLLIDTAGVRRPGKMGAVVEKFSVARSLEAIRRAHVSVLIIDAVEGLVAQDLRLLDRGLSTGKSIVLAVNKWDRAEAEHKTRIKKQLDRRLTFARHLSICFISALNGRGIDRLFRIINNVGANTVKQLKTAELNEILATAISHHPPPLGSGGRRIKLRYAHAVGTAPPVILIHGNQVAAVPDSYRTYLEKSFRAALGLDGSALRLEFKQGENPYAKRKNTLTPSQQRNRSRLIRHRKRRG